MLLEGNRFFLRQLDVARMEGPSNSIVPELRCLAKFHTMK